MEVKDPLKTIKLLSHDDAILVLREMCNGDWRNASDVAASLDVHTATAVKYLSSLYKSGILERKLGRGRTRDVYLYRLRDGRVEINLDLRVERRARDEEVPREFLVALLDKARKTFGDGVGEYLNENNPIRGGRSPKIDFKDVGEIERFTRKLPGKKVRELLDVTLKAIESILGEDSARDLVTGTLRSMNRQYQQSGRGWELASFIESGNPKYFIKEEIS